jgi:hypothetical protein
VREVIPHLLLDFYGMRKVLLIILLLTISAALKAQWISDKDYNTTKEFFRDLRKNNENLSDSDIVVIVTPGWNSINAINWDDAIIHNDDIDFDEVLKIRNKIEISKRFKWNQDIIGQFKPLTSKELSRADKNLNINEFWQHFPHGYNSFSLPVFFKDYTMCIFFWANYCGGLCGHVTVSIYKKEETGWKEYKRLSQIFF